MVDAKREHSGRFQREYFCHNCHLQYAGFYNSEKGREPCPYCADPIGPCAVDTFAHCYCWITRPDSGLGKRSGRNPWLETAWWRREWMMPEWVELYERMGIANEPNMPLTRYWQRRAKESLRKKLKRAGMLK